LIWIKLLLAIHHILIFSSLSAIRGHHTRKRV
jgi:hypothetical protein